MPRNKNLTQLELDKIMSRTIFSGSGISFTYAIMECYSLCRNVVQYIFHNRQQNAINKKYIDGIIKTNNVEHLLPKFQYLRGIKMFDDYKNLIGGHELLKDISEKTDVTENKNSSCVSDFVSYVGGNCWVNAKLSNDLPLNDRDEDMVLSLNKLVSNVEPLDYPITLFHGFENYSNYRLGNTGNTSDNKLSKGSLNMKGFLSKSLSFNIALRFATSKNYFRPNFLVVNYPKGSRHIHPSFRIANEEFEYLTHSNETFMVTDIKKCFMFPRLLTFYICEPAR